MDKSSYSQSYGFSSSVQFSSVAQLYPTLCDPMNPSTPGLPIHHQLPEFTDSIESVVIDKCESWIIRKAEHWRIDAFKLWCWRRLLSPLDSKKIKPVNPKGNHPWIFIESTDAEAPVLWPPDMKSWLNGKTLTLGKTDGRRRSVQQRMRRLDGNIGSMDVSLSKL